MPRAFISVAHEDRAYAEALKSILEAHSRGSQSPWDCWFYATDSDHGTITEEVGDQIKTRPIFIAIVTPTYFTKPICIVERELARAMGKPILHFRPTEDSPALNNLDLKTQPPLFKFGDLSLPLATLSIDVEMQVRGRTRLSLTELATTQLTRRSTDPLRMLPVELSISPNTAPYPGMTTYSTDMGGIFFGRDDAIFSAIEKFTNLVAQRPSGIFVVMGASGSGKSSLLRAGMLSRLALATEHFHVVPPFKPQQAPDAQTLSAKKLPHSFFTEAAQILLHRFGFDTVDAKDHKTPEALVKTLRIEAEKFAKSNQLKENIPIVFSIDQAEELFIGKSSNQEQAEIGHFVDTAKAILRAQRGVYFLLTLRTEEQLQRIYDMDTEVTPFVLPPMRIGDFGQVITGPLSRSEFGDVRLSDDSVKVLQEQAAALTPRETALPVLSYALRELWASRDGSSKVISLPED